MIAQVLALGFGVMKTTDLAKEVFDRTTGLVPQPYLKSLFAMGLSAAAGMTYASTWRDRVLLASGIAGAAAVLHEGQAVLSTTADRNKVSVMTGAMRTGGPGRRVTPL